MSKTSKRAASEQAVAERQHIDAVAQDDLAETEQRIQRAQPPVESHEGMDRNEDDDGEKRIPVTEQVLRDFVAELPRLSVYLGKEVTDGAQASAEQFYKAALAFNPDRRGGLSFYSERTNSVYVRPHGRFMQSFARDALKQAYYGLRDCVREYNRFQMLNRIMTDNRQSAQVHQRPGQAAPDVNEAPWFEGDKRFDPCDAQARVVEDKMLAALPYMALAFICLARVPAATDGRAITTSVTPAKAASDAGAEEQAAKPKSRAERMREAGCWVEDEPVSALPQLPADMQARFLADLTKRAGRDLTQAERDDALERLARMYAAEPEADWQRRCTTLVAALGNGIDQAARVARRAEAAAAKVA